MLMLYNSGSQTVMPHCWFTPGVNFINVLQAAFTHADPKNAQKTVELSVFFVLLGSVLTKVAHRTLMKLNPDDQTVVRELHSTIRFFEVIGPFNKQSY